MSSKTILVSAGVAGILLGTYYSLSNTQEQKTNDQESKTASEESILSDSIREGNDNESRSTKVHHIVSEQKGKNVLVLPTWNYIGPKEERDEAYRRFVEGEIKKHFDKEKTACVETFYGGTTGAEEEQASSAGSAD